MANSRLIATTRQPREVETVAWDTFKKEYFNTETFLQGQHVSIIGSNGRGKSKLAMGGVLPVREAQHGYIVAFDVKGDDESVKRPGYVDIREWPPRRVGAPGQRERHFFRLVPPAKKREQMPNQKKVFRKALRDIYEEGFWTIYLDEARIISDPAMMNLRSDLRAIWIAARNRKVTLIAATQAPKFVPSEMYSEPTHVFIFSIIDEEQAQRLSEIGGDTATIRAINRELEPHEFLYVHTRKRIYVRSSFDLSSAA